MDRGGNVSSFKLSSKTCTNQMFTVPLQEGNCVDLAALDRSRQFMKAGIHDVDESLAE